MTFKIIFLFLLLTVFQSSFAGVGDGGNGGRPVGPEKTPITKEKR